MLPFLEGPLFLYWFACMPCDKILLLCIKIQLQRPHKKITRKMMVLPKHRCFTKKTGVWFLCGTISLHFLTKISILVSFLFPCCVLLCEAVFSCCLLWFMLIKILEKIVVRVNIVSHKCKPQCSGCFLGC